MGASSRPFWTKLDVTHAKTAQKFVLLLKLFSFVVASAASDSESSSDWSSSSGWSSPGADGWSSSSSGWSSGDFGDRAAFMRSQLSFCVLMQAEYPFRQKNLTPRTGPQRWSFARIEQDWGNSSLNCVAYFRFRSVSDLRRLHNALRLPASFSVGHGKHTYLFTGEEARVHTMQMRILH